MSISNRGRKAIVALASAVILAGTLSISTTKAEAFPYWGYGVGGFGAGLALGAIASTATQPAYGYGYGYGSCYITHRPVVDAWGNQYLRRVRVCD